MLNTTDILSTIDMIREQKLDIRTITMGISLLECIGSDTPRRVYDLITRRAERLVQTGEDIENEFGIPIVNKRISVTPVALLLAGGCDPVDIARALDRAAETTGVNFVGGYSANTTEQIGKGEPQCSRNRQGIPQGKFQFILWHAVASLFDTIRQIHFTIN